MATEIKVNKGGPYMIKGMYKLLGIDGKSLQPDGVQSDTVFLCSCGKSKNKPYCDGSHAKEENK